MIGDIIYLFLLHTHALDSLDKEVDPKYTQEAVQLDTAFMGEHTIYLLQKMKLIFSKAGTLYFNMISYSIFSLFYECSLTLGTRLPRVQYYNLKLPTGQLHLRFQELSVGRVLSLASS